MTTSIGFIGTGNMGGAIIHGLASKEGLHIHGFDLSQERLQALKKDTDLIPATSMEELASVATYIVLAVKPQQMKDVVKSIAHLLDDTKRLISIAAGISIKKIAKWAKNSCPVVRVMPNTPALIGKGVFALCLEDQGLTEDDSSFLQDIFAAQGSLFVLPESQFDGFTAVVGSGPAYVCYFMEALIESAVTMGIARNNAQQMVTDLFEGTLKLAQESDKTLAELREMVCSPGGSTIAGLNHFDRTGVKGAIIDGVLAALKRNKELGS